MPDTRPVNYVEWQECLSHAFRGDLMNNLDEFEAKLARLRGICEKQVLAPEELDERDRLLRYLRQEGFDKKEIFPLIRGKLKDDTIRKIIAGVKVADSTIKVRLASLLAEMMNIDLHFSDVQEATQIKKVLASKHVELADISSLVQECRQGDRDVKSIADSFLKQKQSGMSFPQLAEGLAYKKELEAIGLHYSDLKKISELASKNGRQPGKVIESISTLQNLEAVNNELDRALKKLEIRTQRVEKAKIELTKLEVKAAHLRPVVQMCMELVHKLGYATAGIESIVYIAMRYGGAFSVIKALEEYGNIEALKKDKHKLENENIRLAANIAEKQRAVASLQGQLDGIKSAVIGLVNSVREQIDLAHKEQSKLRGDQLQSGHDMYYPTNRPASGETKNTQVGYF